MCADVSVHDKRDGNPHAHIMLTMRPLDGGGTWEHKYEKVYLCKNTEGEEREFTARELAASDGQWQKQHPYYLNGDANSKPIYLTKTESEKAEYEKYQRVKGKNNPKIVKQHRRNPATESWDSVESLVQWREAWARTCNSLFDKLNIDANIDHRSYEDQGIDKVPTTHIGTAGKNMAARGMALERVRMNSEDAVRNAERESLVNQINVLQKQIDRIEDEGAILNAMKIYKAGGSGGKTNIDSLGTIFADELSRLWYKFVQTRIQSESLSIMRGKESEYRRTAAALYDKYSEYVNNGKQIKALRRRFENSSVFNAPERKAITEQINALTNTQKGIADALIKEYGLSITNVSAQIKQYNATANKFRDDLAAYPSSETQSKTLAALEEEFLLKYKTAVELPAGKEIYDMFQTGKEPYKKEITGRQTQEYDVANLLNKASARLEKAVENIEINTRHSSASGGGLNLIIDLRSNLKAQNSVGYQRWAKLHNLKMAAQTLVFLENNNISSVSKLNELADAAKTDYTDTRAKINDAEQRLKDNAATQKHLRQYARTRDVYAAYKKSGYSKKFRQAHEQEIQQHQTSKKFFDSISAERGAKLPTIKELKAEYAEILAAKKQLYPQYAERKERNSDILTAKKNIDLYLGLDARDTTARDVSHRPIIL
jgi:hypothetical protein